MEVASKAKVKKKLQVQSTKPSHRKLVWKILQVQSSKSLEKSVFQKIISPKKLPVQEQGL